MSSSSRTVLFIPKAQYRLSPEAHDIYVTKTPDGKFKLKSEGILPSNTGHDFYKQLDLALSDETDITASVQNSVDYTFTTRVGIMFTTFGQAEDGSEDIKEVAPSIGIADTIVEWRSNILKEPKKKSTIGRTSKLMQNYAAVGIPYTTYLWFKERLLEQGIVLVHGPKDGIVTDEASGKQYVFINANITETNPVMVKYNAKLDPVALADFMIKLGQSAIGNGIFDVHLKRERDEKKQITSRYVMSLTFRGYVCKGVTNIKTPPLDPSSSEYVLSDTENFSAELANVMNAVSTISVGNSGFRMPSAPVIRRPGVPSTSSSSSPPPPPNNTIPPHSTGSASSSSSSSSSSHNNSYNSTSDDSSTESSH